MKCTSMHLSSCDGLLLIPLVHLEKFIFYSHTLDDYDSMTDSRLNDVHMKM